MFLLGGGFARQTHEKLHKFVAGVGYCSNGVAQMVLLSPSKTTKKEVPAQMIVFFEAPVCRGAPQWLVGPQKSAVE